MYHIIGTLLALPGRYGDTSMTSSLFRDPDGDAWPNKSGATVLMGDSRTTSSNEELEAVESVRRCDRQVLAPFAPLLFVAVVETSGLL